MTGGEEEEPEREMMLEDVMLAGPEHRFATTRTQADRGLMGTKEQGGP